MKKSLVSTDIEKEIARILRKSLPNILQDEADHAAEIIMLYLKKEKPDGNY